MNIKSEENIPFFLYFPIFYYFCVVKNYPIRLFEGNLTLFSLIQQITNSNNNDKANHYNLFSSDACLHSASADAGPREV